MSIALGALGAKRFFLFPDLSRSLALFSPHLFLVHQLPNAFILL